MGAHVTSFRISSALYWLLCHIRADVYIIAVFYFRNLYHLNIISLAILDNPKELYNPAAAGSNSSTLKRSFVESGLIWNYIRFSWCLFWRRKSENRIKWDKISGYLWVKNQNQLCIRTRRTGRSVYFLPINIQVSAAAAADAKPRITPMNTVSMYPIIFSYIHRTKDMLSLSSPF